MGLRQFSDDVGKLERLMDKFGRTSAGSSRHVGKLEEDITNLGDATIATRQHTEKATDHLAKFGLALKALDTGVSKYIIAWKDASRVSLRGSRLLDTSHGKLMQVQEQMSGFAAGYSKLTGQSIEESTAITRAMMEGFTKYKKDINMDDALASAESYKQAIAGAQRLANIGAQEMGAFMKQVSIRADLGLEESEAVIDNISKAAVEYGVTGSDSIRHMSENMDRIVSLDTTAREKQLKKMLNYVGIEERAMIDFGKYVGYLKGSEGVDAYTQAEMLAAFSGGDSGSIMKDMMLAAAGTDAAATIRMLETQTKALENVAPGLIELQQASITGKKRDGSDFTGDDAKSLRIAQEVALQTIGQTTGLDIATMATMAADLKRLQERGITGDDLLAEMKSLKKTTNANMGQAGIGDDAASALDTATEGAMSSMAHLSEGALKLGREFEFLEKTVRNVHTALQYLIPLGIGVAAVFTTLSAVGGLTGLTGSFMALGSTLVTAASTGGAWGMLTTSISGAAAGLVGLTGVVGALVAAYAWVMPKAKAAKQAWIDADAAEHEAQISGNRADTIGSIKDSWAKKGKNVEARAMMKALESGDKNSVDEISRRAIPVQTQQDMASQMHVALTERGLYADYQFLMDEAQKAYASGGKMDLATIAKSSGVKNLMDMGGADAVNSQWQSELQRQKEWWGAKGADIDVSNLTMDKLRGTVNGELTPLNDKVPMDKAEPPAVEDRKEKAQEDLRASNMEGLLNGRLGEVIALLDQIARTGRTAPV